MTIGRVLATASAGATLLFALPAAAGGIDELPDQGGQALGRGAAFTAKADDATAIYYNVAGLARQRGTKLQISANNHFNTMTFQRAGKYADDPNDPLTPWGGQKYPLVEDKNKSFTLPMLLVTSDFGVLDRLTFGLGVYGPAATGRTFQLGIAGQPSPARYDSVASKSSLLFPTLAAAYRITDQLDLGLGAFLAIANADQLAIAYADSGGNSCKNPEYRPCDAEGNFKGSGTGAGLSVGAMFRINEAVQLGLQVRSPIGININGTTTAKIGGAKEATEPAVAGTSLDLPLVVRLGGRYITMENKRELWDVELDAIYEKWGSAQDPGPQVKTSSPIDGSPTSITILHKWHDTFGIRAGGAYNYALDEQALSVFVFRGGAYYDGSASDSPNTRLDTNTLAKVAGTVGIGFKRGAFSLNLAYAAVLSLSRTVTDGALVPGNSAKGGDPVDGNGKPLPATNNGDYSAFSHVLGLSIEVNFEALFRDRKPTFGNPEYEDLAGDEPPKKQDLKKQGDEPSETPASPPPTTKKKKKEKEDPPGTWWKPRVPDDQLQNAPADEDEEAPTPRRPKR